MGGRRRQRSRSMIRPRPNTRATARSPPSIPRTPRRRRTTTMRRVTGYRENSPSPSGTLAATSEYDLGGRLSSSTDTSGNITSFAYDLLDRRLSASIAGNRVSQTTYNSLGWPMSETDPDGVVTTWTYDKEGRVLSRVVTRGGLDAATAHEFDDLGRDVKTTNPDGTQVIETAFDAFGRVTARIERIGGTIVHDEASVFDEMGRLERSTDAPAETTVTCTYATSPQGQSFVTRDVRGATLIVISNAQGLECTRTLVLTGSVPATMQVDVSRSVRDGAKRPFMWDFSAPGLSRGASTCTRTLWASPRTASFGSSRRTTTPGCSIRRTPSTRADDRPQEPRGPLPSRRFGRLHDDLRLHGGGTARVLDAHGRRVHQLLIRRGGPESFRLA